MLLGLSSAELGVEVDAGAVRASTDHSGIEHSDELIAMVDAIAGADPAAIADARERLAAAIGHQAAVDAIAVCGNFHMMTRIADGTGTPLDSGSAAITGDLRADLDLDGLVSARIDQP